MCEPVGRIFDIQRFCIHDGPGIRTTVFLQGCPLRCLWCHNPEGRVARTLLSFQPDKCVGCGWCVAACEHDAHVLDPETGTHTLNRELCVVCGRCVEQCYAGALELVGRRVTVAEVLDEVRKDLPFYQNSGGGMTLSGGEPLAQIEFAAGLLEAAGAQGIHRTVETCGAVPYGNLERALPSTDLFFYDIKETDPKRHREYTGADNQRILANLPRLHGAGARIRLRLPMIPGLNDRPDHFDALAALTEELPELEGAEIMPYHRLGTSKLTRFGWDSELDVEPPSPETVRRWIEALRGRGVPVIDPDAAPSEAGSR